MKMSALVLMCVWFTVSCNNSSDLVGGVQAGVNTKNNELESNGTNNLNDNTSPFPLPSNSPPTASITQGSFTVWTIPEDPSPDENYQIQIQVEYPGDVSTIERGDLSGCIIGTDGFFNPILDRSELVSLEGLDYTPDLGGFDDFGPPGFDDFSPALSCEDGVSNLTQNDKLGFKEGEDYNVSSNTATLKVFIPGAANLVRDTIKVRSSVLDETQEIFIEF